MTGTRLVHSLRKRGFQVRLVGDRVGVTPSQTLQTEDRELLQQHKAEIIEHLRGEQTYAVPAGWTPEAWLERLRYLAELSKPNNPTASEELIERADGVARYCIPPAPDPAEIRLNEWIHEIARRECGRTRDEQRKRA